MAHELMSKDTMMSVREMPWHGLGTVLDDYPKSIDEAIEKSGLGWKVRQGSVLVSDGDGDPRHALAVADRIAAQYQEGGIMAVDTALLEEYLVTDRPSLTLAKDWRANRREDDGDILGIVSGDYRVVQNEDAFRFLDSLINSDLHFETAGSLQNGKRVWVLVRLPEFIEVGGDETATFVYVANSHDGSLSVTAAATPIRIVCANTLGWALRKSEEHAERTYKFRHTGDLQNKYDEARRVIGLTVNYQKQFKALGDRLAQEPLPLDSYVKKVVEPLFPITDDLGKVAVANRKRTHQKLVDIYQGVDGSVMSTVGNSPGTKWAAANAVAEFSDWNRRYTKSTDQMGRSFEDNWMKQKGLELVLAA